MTLLRTLTLTLTLVAAARVAAAETQSTAPTDLSNTHTTTAGYSGALLTEHERYNSIAESFQPWRPPLTSQANEPRGFLYAGYEHVLVKPYFSRNIAYWNNSPVGVSEFSSFDWNTTYTPRVHLGYQAPSGVGLRARYWSFDGSTSFSRQERAGENLFVESTIADASVSVDVDDTLVGRHAIEASVVDLEFTKRGEYCWGWLMGGGGLRYTEMEQGVFWLETETPPLPGAPSSGGPPESISLRHGFEGVGPTLSLEGGTPLFGSDFSFFASGRASLLFGDRSAIVLGVSGGDVIPSFDGLLSIFAAQAGFDWTKAVRGRQLILRTALEAQSWRRGGGASGGDDEGLPADQIDLGFFGASVSTIVEF